LQRHEGIRYRRTAIASPEPDDFGYPSYRCRRPPAPSSPQTAARPCVFPSLGGRIGLQHVEEPFDKRRNLARTGPSPEFQLNAFRRTQLGPDRPLRQLRPLLDLGQVQPVAVTQPPYCLPQIHGDHLLQLISFNFPLTQDLAS
jgi:hypothetical protein